MNAKITITIPVEKLTGKVSEILEEVASELDVMSVDLTAISKESAKENDLLKQLKNIDEKRKKLTLLDARMEDCYSILSGYIKYKAEEKEQKNVNTSTE